MDKKVSNLIKLAGDRGRYQYLSLVIAFLVWAISAFHSVSLPFLEKNPLVKYKDQYGNYHNGTYQLNYSICEGKNFTQVEDLKFSWLNDTELACNKFKVSLIGSLNYAGFTLGSFSFGIVSKFIPMKILIFIAMCVYSVLLVIMTLAKNYYCYIVLILFLGVGTNLANYSSVSIVGESVASEKRAMFSCIINVGFTFNALIFTPIYLWLKNWQYVFYADIGLSIVVLALVFIFLNNSPRHYLMRRMPEKGLEILRKIAKFNKKLDDFEEGIKDEEYNDLLHPEELKEGEDNKDEPKQKFTYISLIKYKSIRYKFILFSIMFFCTSGIYNAIALSAKDMPLSLYVNMILLYIFEAIAYIVTGFMINSPKLGRKGSLIIFFVVSAIGFITYNILTKFNAGNVPKLCMMFIVRFSISAIYTTYYTFIMENYPTPIRSLGFGLNSTCGNLGGIVSPFFLEYVGRTTVYYIFGGILSAACVAILFLEETVGKPMKESIDELEGYVDVEGVEEDKLIEDSIDGSKQDEILN